MITYYLNDEVYEYDEGKTVNDKEFSSKEEAMSYILECGKKGYKTCLKCQNYENKERHCYAFDVPVKMDDLRLASDCEYYNNTQNDC